MGSVRSEIWGSHRKVSRMVTKKKTVRDLALEVVESERVHREQQEQQRAKDLELYRGLIAELAGADQRDSELLKAARIVGERCGFGADNDLRHLDAIRDCERLTSEFGDLDEYQARLRQEQGGFAEEQQALLQRHHIEQTALRQKHLEHGRYSVRVGGIVDAAAKARAAINHLQVEVM
jgi:hypothetical protein